MLTGLLDVLDVELGLFALMALSVFIKTILRFCLVAMVDRVRERVVSVW